METSTLLTILLGSGGMVTLMATLLKVLSDNSKFVAEVARLDNRINHLEEELKESRKETDNWRRVYAMLLDKHLGLRSMYQRETGNTLMPLELPEMD